MSEDWSEALALPRPLAPKARTVLGTDRRGQAPVLASLVPLGVAYRRNERQTTVPRTVYLKPDIADSTVRDRTKTLWFGSSSRPPR